MVVEVVMVVVVVVVAIGDTPPLSGTGDDGAGGDREPQNAYVCRLLVLPAGVPESPDVSSELRCQK